MSEPYEHYYVPEKSHWPAVGSIGLGLTVIGIVNVLHDNSMGTYVLLAGVFTVLYMMYGWFRDVICESMSGLYSKQMDRSFRMGMFWFITSEVMFFVAFFGALFYTRNISVPWLAGIGSKELTGQFLWPQFQAAWPLLNNPNPEIFKGPHEIIAWNGLPLINTILLVTSSLTITWAHWGLEKNARTQLKVGLLLTILLGITFLFFQAEEYIEAYKELGLTLDSGIYGSTFFLLTGFHGAHVTLGTIMLIIMLLRSMKGHFTPKSHFAFQATAWYWHFVDVVWVGLFFLVYLL